MKKLLFALLATSLLANVALATKKKVLFIGNSYLAVNNVPSLVDSISRAMGDTLEYDSNMPGGFTFRGHSSDLTTLAKISLTDWDIVVLQAQSQEPSFPPSQVATETYPYATRLDSAIRANDSCTETMFLMTWGRANGDAANCPFYPVICTYLGMQRRLRESYMEMALDNRGVVAPVGAAWKVMRDSFPSIWLYSPDSSHPIIQGSYLEAITLYSSIFHKSAVGCSYTAGIPTGDALKIQRISKLVTMDSLNVWQQHGQYPYAGFTQSGGGNYKTFTSSSTVSSTHSWTFGDGGTDTSRNPTHRYTAIGTYVVTHTVSNGCFTEQYTDTVRITTISIGVNEVHNANSQIKIANQGNGHYELLLPASDIAEVEVYNVAGQVIRKFIVDNRTVIADNLTQGVFIYRALNNQHQVVETGRFGIY